MVDEAFIRHVGLQHGSVPAAGATQWLPLIVGDRRAREIVMLCEEIPAAKALEWGLVNRVVPAAELDETVDELVGKLADRLPLMARYAKAQLDFFRDQAWYGTIRHAHDWLALSMLTEDAAAGVQGFLDRRKES
jgi:enoyl-CoA hydratase/carnithine racemase